MAVHAAADSEQSPPLVQAAPVVPVKEPLPLSIFFTKAEQQRIQEAWAAYEQSKISGTEEKSAGLLGLLSGLGTTKETPVEKTFTYPQFFLSSLVYHGKDDWVVLIDNNKFSAKGLLGNDELKLLEVDNEKVFIEWKPKKMDRVNQSWAKNKNKDILVDPVAGTVTFTLYPNQTFSSFVMRVLEGKVMPVTVKIKQDSNNDTPSAD